MRSDDVSVGHSVETSVVSKRYQWLRDIMVLVLVCLVGGHAAMAADIPTGQDLGSMERQLKAGERRKATTRDLIKGKEQPDIDQEAASPPAAPAGQGAVTGAQVVVNDIIVTGSTVFSDDELQSMVADFRGRTLGLAELQAIADTITDAYRAQGYLTTLVYIPPQRIEGNTVTIAIAEGTVGDVQITGNQHFSSSLLLRHVDARKGQLFNYDALRDSITRLNAHPDRSARVALERGAARGETDVHVQVVDQRPFHAALAYSNHNSRFLDRNKASVELRSTNFLGRDHLLAVEAQVGEDDHYQLYSARYLLPATAKGKVGVRYIHLVQELGRSVEALNIEGDGDIISMFYTHELVNTDTKLVTITPGFEYKDIENQVLSVTTSEDRMRIAKLGFDLDLVDRWDGRTIITQEFDYGIDDIFGGLEDKDPRASRVGAGGKFFRSVTNAAHIHPLPHAMDVMIRAAMQLTAYTLVASEQFHIGGATTVRGYPVSEQAGDQGYTVTAEVYVPPHFVPESVNVPGTNTSVFDALRLVLFADYGHVSNNSPGAGESKSESLYSVGPGLRIEVPGKLSAALDYGFALGQNASDGSDGRGYVEIKVFF